MGFSLELTEVTQFKITAKELDVRESRLQSKKFQYVLDLVAKGKLDLIDSSDSSIRKVVLTFE